MITIGCQLPTSVLVGPVRKTRELEPIHIVLSGSENQLGQVTSSKRSPSKSSHKSGNSDTDNLKRNLLLNEGKPKHPSEVLYHPAAFD